MGKRYLEGSFMGAQTYESVEEKKARKRYISATGDREAISRRSEYTQGNYPEDWMPAGARTAKDRISVYNECAKQGITWAKYLGARDWLKLSPFVTEKYGDKYFNDGFIRNTGYEGQEENEARNRYMDAIGDPEAINNHSEYSWGLLRDSMPKGAKSAEERVAVYNECVRLGISWAEHLGVGDWIKRPPNIIL